MKGKKTGGRKKGTPNVVTAFSKSVIQDIIDRYTNSDQFTSDFGRLDPKDRIDVIIKLTGFVLPKPQSVDFNMNTETKKTIEDQLRELSKENDV